MITWLNFAGALVIVLNFFPLTLGAQSAPPDIRRRILVSTDIGGSDPDDFQSMAHLLLYADAFDLEGLVSSPWGAGRKQDILNVIGRYEQDYPRLVQRSDLYPKPDALRAISKQGAIDSAGLDGYATPTEGSDWIIHCAKRDDPRPLWILVWGGIDDLAQALHDQPAILSKLHVYYIGGPNKKWAATAYDYIARAHPDLWIIEANSTYRGWFTGGNQSGDWGNARFVKTHLAGRGALGDYFASILSGSLKMGDSPSVAYLLGKSPEDPASVSWGGQFVRAWDRPRYWFNRPTTTRDQVESFSIVEWTFQPTLKPFARAKASLVIDQQEFPGFLDESGAWHFFFSPKEARTWAYSIKSADPLLNGLSGNLISVMPSPEQALRPSLHFPNWWTDDPNPQLAEGPHQGAKTINRWREDYLRDFAERAARALPAANPPPKPR